MRPALKRAIAGVLLGAALFLTTTGCGSKYASVSQDVARLSENREYDAAIARIEGLDEGPDRLLVVLERGLLQHYAGHYEDSNETFQVAEDLIEELYTKSISNEAASLLTSDNIRPYDGATFERVMVPFYRAFNYIALDSQMDALVEARKANAALELYTQDLDEPAYGDDAFLQYCTGLIYGWGGEWNDAFVSLRKAEAAYIAGSETGGPPVPDGLKRDLLRVARRVGDTGRTRAYRELYPDAAPVPLSPGYGEILAMVEVGFVPRLVEARIDVPILKSDDGDGAGVWTVSNNAYHRIGNRYKKTELAYLLSIAYPVFPERDTHTHRVELRAGTSGRTMEHVSDLARNARRNYDDRQSSILIRTIARALIKYIAKEKAEDQDKTLGLIVDLLGSVTESADVRSWRGLPGGIHLLRLPLPAGTHDVVLTSGGADGDGGESVTLSGVDVVAGETTWVSYRLYR